MHLCYGTLVVLLVAILVLPKTHELVIPAMVILLLVAICCFLVRGIYYAPIGEMGIGKVNGAAAMAVASFIGYSPSFWGYPLFGFLIGKFDSARAYQYIFILLIVLAACGFTFTHFIGKRVVSYRANQKAENSSEDSAV
jgi:hypothetical protein